MKHALARQFAASSTRPCSSTTTRTCSSTAACSTRRSACCSASRTSATRKSRAPRPTSGGGRREGLDLRFGLGCLDTEITNSVVDGVATGSELPNSPEITFSSMVALRVADQRIAHGGSGGRARLPGQRHFRHRPRRRPRRIEGSYWLYDARVGIGSADDRWNVSLWGKNLADERIPHAGHQLQRGLRRDLGYAADLRPDVHDADVIEGDVHHCDWRR